MNEAPLSAEQPDLDLEIDLLLEANLLDELVDELFAPGGFWAGQE